MVSFTLPANSRFAVGSTVSVYARSAFAEGGGPFAAAVTSATVGSDGSAAFTGLDADTAYWAAQQQSGSWVRIAFRTDGPRQANRVWVASVVPATATTGDIVFVQNDDGSVSIYQA